MSKDAVKNRKRKKLRQFHIWLGLIAGLLFLIMFLLAILLPDKELSVQEKRVLSSFPRPYLNRIAEGSYSTDFETYVSDQIPFRNFFTKMKVFTDRLAGRQESQGVYRGKDGCLIEKMEDWDQEQLNTTLDAVIRFTKTYEKETAFVLVPTAVSVMQEKLPLFAPTASQENFSRETKERLKNTEIRFTDLTETLTSLKETGMQLYYRTDHHWTTEAAAGCAETVLKALGHTAKLKGKLLPVTDSFCGSLAAKSGYASGEKEVIDLWVPEEETLYLMTDSKGKHATLYSEEGLKSNDPYTVFLGGNEGLIRIETEQFGKSSLLVFKDSYFNCFLPCLLGEYERVDVVDPRYYDGDITSLMLQNDYDQILFFYNMNTFSEDTSLSLVLTGTEEPEEAP